MSAEHEPAYVKPGRCPEDTLGLLGRPLSCGLAAGHNGMHHDDATGADWQEGQAPTPDFVRDLLSSDGQPRPGDEHLTGLGEALRPLSRELQMEVAAALYTYAAERLTVAEEAEQRAKYIPPHEFRARNLVTAARIARLWREAVHAR